MEKRYDYITPDDYRQADLNGISAQLLEQRVRSFLWDVDKAVNTPKKKQRCFKVTWAKWKEIAYENGIDRDAFTNRVRSLGWDELSAATTPKGTRRSKWTSEEIEIAKTNGVDGNSMKIPSARLRLGWSKEKALETPKMTDGERLERVREGVKNRRVNREFNKII